MKYLLIAFVIFLALAPLSYFIPSKRQRMVAGMREYAATHGLFVEFRSPPEKWERGRTSAAASSLIYYGKRLYHSPGRAIRHSAWVRDEWGWRGLNRPSNSPEILSELPESITLANLDEGSCGVFWDEEGGEEMLHQICAVLSDWSSQLETNPTDFS